METNAKPSFMSGYKLAHILLKSNLWGCAYAFICTSVCMYIYLHEYALHAAAERPLTLANIFVKLSPFRAFVHMLSLFHR